MAEPQKIDSWRVIMLVGIGDVVIGAGLALAGHLGWFGPGTEALLPVGGSSAPWKSLNPSRWPFTVDPLPPPCWNATLTGDIGVHVSAPPDASGFASGSRATTAAARTGTARCRASRNRRG